MIVEAAALEVATPAGSVVRGQRWGEGANVAVLLHAPGEDLDAWGDLPAYLIAGGLAVVAVDLPGHGLSDGPWQPARLSGVVRAVVDQTRAAGAVRVFLVASEASVWGTLSVGTAGAEALVALSPPDAQDDRQAADARAARLPKLLLVGAREEGALAAARRLFARCAGWSLLSTLPTREQGTRLLAGPWGAQAREQIVAFLRDHAALGSDVRGAGR